ARADSRRSGVRNGRARFRLRYLPGSVSVELASAVDARSGFRAPRSAAAGGISGDERGGISQIRSRNASCTPEVRRFYQECKDCAGEPAHRLPSKGIGLAGLIQRTVARATFSVAFARQSGFNTLFLARF